MPKKGVKERTYNPKDMAKAISAIRENQMGYKLAAKTFHVPRTTLFRLVKKYPEKGADEITSAVYLGRKPVFPKNMEEDLVKYVCEMESRYFGCTHRDICNLAYQLAVKNNIPHPFSVKRQCAGKDWLRLFMKRHPELTFRIPTGTSVARAKGFNRENVNDFFDILDSALEKHKFQADRIFNVDETGFSIVPSKQAKVISIKGKRQVGSLTSAERGCLITTVLSMSAAGQFVPPLFVFPRKKANSLLMKGAPSGSIAAYHSSGWIQLEIFTQWFDHFIQKVKPTKDDPVLLILDGHYSHTRNLDVIEKARQAFVTIISLPPHSTHKLQPLDKSVMGPLKSYYNEEIRLFLRNNGRKVSIFDVCELFSKAYSKVQTADLAAAGFRCTGIWPFDRNIFIDSDFIAAPTEINISIAANQPQPSTGNASPATRYNYTPWQISPVPVINECSSNRGRKGTKAAIITSSPHRSNLESAKSRNEKSISKEKIKTKE